VIGAQVEMEFYCGLNLLVGRPEAEIADRTFSLVRDSLSRRLVANSTV